MGWSARLNAERISRATAGKLIPTPYVVITADGFRSEHEVQWPYEPGYKLLCGVILPHLRAVRAAAHLEHVRVLFDDRPADMFVDDCGAIAELPVNPVATAIYQTAWRRRFPLTGEDTLHSIHGAAVIFRRQVWF
jgi:hypothetical protein